MAGVDLGKQVGPLPLGAWVAVVAGGLGIAIYTRRQSNANSEPAIVDDTSGTPGVGVGGSGMYTDLTPVVTPPTAASYTDNDSWGQAAINRLTAMGYNSGQVYSAITKALAGGSGDNQLSVSEYAIWSEAVRVLQAPPTPIAIPTPPTNTPPTTTPPTTTPAAGQRMRMQWVTSKVGVPNESLRTKQWNIAKQACAAKVWCPSSASFNAVLAQAQIRSGVGNVNGILKVGRSVTLYRPVPY